MTTRLCRWLVLLTLLLAASPATAFAQMRFADIWVLNAGPRIISCSSDPGASSGTAAPQGTIALCTDGTLWQKTDVNDTDWSQAAVSDIQTLLDGISTTQGVILYYNGTNWVALGPGTSGHCLQTQGAGANPQWASCGAGGGAPTDATYITQTANGTLSAEQALASLSTGIMRVATTTGVITSLTDSAGIAANISDETGSGALVFAGSPALTTPNLGTPSAVTLTNGTGLPISTGVAGLGTGVATFLGTPSSANLASAVTGETGSGALVFASSPALTTPDLGTPSAATLTNATGLPISTGVSGLGTGVATFLGTPSSANLAAAVTGETGSGALVFASSPALTTPDLGTPSAATLTNATGLPISTGVSGLGTGVATFLGTPSSANLAAAVTGESGTGALVFNDSATLITPTFSGAAVWPDDVRQTFNPGSTNAGLNVGALAGDPASPANGDLWYDSTANELTARINGADVALGAGGGGGAPTDAEYWVGAAHGSLSAEHNLGGLSTGLVLNTSGTPSAYAGTSCTNQFARALNASGAATCETVSLTADVTGDLPYANLTAAGAASRLLGRGSASGAGDWQEISLGSGLSMSGTTLSATGGGSLTLQERAVIVNLDASVFPDLISNQITSATAPSIGNLTGYVLVDGATDNGVYVSIDVPPSYSGSPVLVIKGVLDGAVGGTDVLGFGFRKRAVANNESADGTFDAEQTVSATIGATGGSSHSDEDLITMEITLTGGDYSASDLVLGHLYLDVSSTTYTGNFILMSVSFKFSS